MIGKKFGRLEVVSFVEKRGKHKYWKCRCECGNFKVVSASNLVTGNTRSCGCMRKENWIKIQSEKRGAKNPNYRHGLSRSRLYVIWSGMKQRCQNPKATEYSCYGGRGISVCREWLNDFKVFYMWAINNGCSDNLTIDRIDVNGNYEPDNCRWIPQEEQYKNMQNK